MKELSINKVIEELNDYSELGNDSYTESTTALINLYRYRAYLNPEMQKALETELREQHKNYTDFCEVLEEVEVRTITTKYLEWN
jgi:hypothetical protein